MDRNALILLATGEDRPGIVDQISGAIYEAGCNLEDSRMSILGGEFALIVLVSGQGADLPRAENALREVCGRLGLTTQFKRTSSAPSGEGRPPAIPYALHAVSMDHPGIVHKVTRVLSSHGVNVARLDTHVVHAPVTGTPVFSLDLEAQVPAELSISVLRGELRRLAEEENIDIELRPEPMP